ncbi:MAG: hypothetical protein RIB84_03020 [Sneathiellaceae bacterium]
MSDKTILEKTEDRLAGLSLTLPTVFTFVWQGRRVQVSCDNKGDDMQLTAIADLGPLPFTSEAADQRNRLKGLLRWQSRRAERRLALHRGRLALMLRQPFPGPVSADAILAETVALLLQGRPMARLVDEVRTGRI